MRLTKLQESQATTELLTMLADDGAHGGEGLRTSELRGTTRFHGSRTLSHKQIARLLRASGKAEAELAGNGARTYNLWTLIPTVQSVCNKASQLKSGMEKLEQAHGGTFAIG
jgi:hypothetical protein